MQKAWKNLFGGKAVIAVTCGTTNEVAQAKGYRVVNHSTALNYFGILRASDVITKGDTFDEVEVSSKIMDEVNEALDIMEVPCAVGFFKHYDGAPLGKAEVSKSVAYAWLNEKLALPGNRVKRLSTLAHEICHVESGASDGSMKFQYSLDELCGKLLDKLLGR